MASVKQIPQLVDAFGKSKIETGLYGFVKKFYVKHLWDIAKILPGNPNANFAVEKLKEKKQPNKADLNIMCFSVFENKEIYTLFLATLPEYIQQLIEILIWREAIHHLDAEKELKVKLLDEEKNSYRRPELKKDFYFFKVDEDSNWTSAGRAHDYFLSIPKLLRDILVEYYPKPAFYTFVPVVDVPEGMAVFSGEKQIFLEITAIISYHLQALVKYTNSGKPSEATINKMQRSCNIAEFYHDDLLKNIRTQMIAGMLYGLKIKDINLDGAALLKILFTEHYKVVYTPQFVLTQFKGWGYVNHAYTSDTSFAAMLDTIKQLPPGKWESIQNLHGYISSHTISVRGVESYIVNNSLSFNEAFINAGRSPKTLGLSMELVVKKPYINGAVFLLAAFGLLEIAYTGIDTQKFGETYFSPYDGLAFVKLTALGAYVFGLIVDYTPQHINSQNKLHFSEDSLTILAEGDLSVIDIMLSRFAEREGIGRYRITTAVFFKDCKNLAAVEAKITLFKKTVSVKLPRYWDAAFAEWKANAKVVQAKDNFFVFQIPAATKGLQSLLARDAVLKSIIFKAEGFYILVEHGNVAKFKQRLKELGYFIE